MGTAEPQFFRDLQVVLIATVRLVQQIALQAVIVLDQLEIVRVLELEIGEIESKLADARTQTTNAVQAVGVRWISERPVHRSDLEEPTVDRLVAGQTRNGMHALRLGEVVR